MTVSREEQRKLQELSPFELKNRLIELADDNNKKNAVAMLNAEREQETGRDEPGAAARCPVGRGSRSRCARGLGLHALG